MSGGVNESSNSVVSLVIGQLHAVEQALTIITGQNLAKGTVLGKITLGAASAAAKSGGNTGDGTLTLDVTTPILAKAKAGVYKVRIKRAAIAEVGTTPAVPAQEAIAELTDPDGNVLVVVDVPTTPGVTISNQVKFALVEGSTPYAAGDGFDITIAAGSGKYKAYAAANVDGSQYPEAILFEAVDATSADVKSTGYFTGEFNEAAVTGLDAAAKVALRNKAIFFKKVYG